MKNMIVIGLFAVAMLVMSCAKEPETVSNVEDTTTRVTHIVRTNLGDLSFNDSAWSGVERAGEELGFEVRVIEIGGDQTKYEPTVVDVAESDADIIIVNSGALAEAAEKHVPVYPDKKFIFIDMQPTFQNTYDNVIAVSFKQNESSYLAGVLAGLMTETDNIGFVGGTENIIINDFMVGYINGAVSVNPDIKIQTALIGNFTDTARSKELGLVQINNGADFIHSVAGSAGLGVIDAVVQQKGSVWSIGVDSDQAMVLKPTAPDKAEVIITSALKNVGDGLFAILKRINDGEAEWGSLESMGIRENAAGIAMNEYYYKNVPADVQDVINEAAEKITNGEIQVPTAFDMTADQIIALKNQVRP